MFTKRHPRCRIHQCLLLLLLLLAFLISHPPHFHAFRSHPAFPPPTPPPPTLSFSVSIAFLSFSSQINRKQKRMPTATLLSLAEQWVVKRRDGRPRRAIIPSLFKQKWEHTVGEGDSRRSGIDRVQGALVSNALFRHEAQFRSDIWCLSCCDHVRLVKTALSKINTL